MKLKNNVPNWSIRLKITQGFSCFVVSHNLMDTINEYLSIYLKVSDNHLWALQFEK